MATSFGTDDFIIDLDQVKLIKKHFKKTEKLFGVKLNYGDVYNDGGKSKQWMVVTGCGEARRGAKSYILAINCPDQVTQVLFAQQPALDNLILEGAERKSSAFVERTGPKAQAVKIKGTEMACAKAVSYLEQVYSVRHISKEKQEQNPDKPASQVENGAAVNLPPRSRDAGPQVVDLTDDASGSAGSARLEDIDDHQLFASGHSNSPILKSSSGPFGSVHTPLKTIPPVQQKVPSPAAHTWSKVSASTSKTVPGPVVYTFSRDGPVSVSSLGQQQTVANPPMHSPNKIPAVRQMVTRPNHSPTLSHSPMEVAEEQLKRCVRTASGDIGVSAVGNSSQISNKIGPISMAFAASPADRANLGTGPNQPVSKGDRQRAVVWALAAGMGYSEEEIKETCEFFDFDKHTVLPDEFLIFVEEIRSSRLKKGNMLEVSSALKAGQDSVSDSTPKRSEQQHGEKPERTSSEKRSAIFPTQSSHQLEPPVTPSVGGGSSAAGAVCSSTSTNRSRSSLSTPTSQVSSSSDILDKGAEQAVANENKVSESTGSSNSMDDSVICMGEDLDDSVYITGVSVSKTAQGEHVVLPPTQRSSSVPLPRKRKELYSDDEEQTSVLKPFSPPGPAVRSSSDSVRFESTHNSSNLAPSSQPALSPPDINQPGPHREANTAKDHNSDLRFIVIDGSNVAMKHGNDKVFSCRGIKICVDYFVSRGHRVKAWVPKTKTYKSQVGYKPVHDKHILDELKDEGYLSFTPARTLNHRHVVSHDDYFILDLAKLEDAVVVSNDNFREFNADYAHVIENRVLSFAFAYDHFMPSRDPLGRYGPPLDEFLRKTPTSNFKQHARKGASHRSRSQQRPFPAQPQPSLAQPQPSLAQQRPSLPQQRPSPDQQQQPFPGQQWPGLAPPQGPGFKGHGNNHPAGPELHGAPLMGPVQQQQLAMGRPGRHPDVTRNLFVALQVVFPEKEQAPRLQQVLNNHPTETDLNKLTNYCISALNM